MALIPTLKSLTENVPYPIGSAVARIPYSVRPGAGSVYRRRKREIARLAVCPPGERDEFVLTRMQQVVKHAYQNVPFYRAHYDKHNFHPDQLRTFSDIQRIPFVDKKTLQGVTLEERSYAASGRYVVNTGGSSGEPLSFYILPGSIGHEWAHMHHIWASLGYRQSDLKLTFSGRLHGSGAATYDALRHHFAVNTYLPWPEVAAQLRQVLRRYPVRYLHGYPSTLSDFASYCVSEDPELTAMLQLCLRGAFLGSEFPAPAYRDKITHAFGCPTVSWYGHTERAVLAWEAHSRFEYEPLISYGYAETRLATSGQVTLVGTSYYNTASPLIRYDTGDSVEVLAQHEGALTRFRIAGGRQGDFVEDASGKRISLTGLIFGRHHRVFDQAQFVQVEQPTPGHVTLVVTARPDQLLETTLPSLFDLAGVDISFDYRLVSEPVTTRAGKVPLRIPPENK